MNWLFKFITVLLCANVCAQNTEQFLGTLPHFINESSGVDVDSQGRIWTHNDGGNANKIYQISNTGQLLKTVTLNNATNIDWEDVTIDQNDIMYLADMGNNNNDRTDLCIYIIDLKSITNNTTTINAQKLFFNYEDQLAFPPPNNQKNFDAEAIAWFDDSLYIFTKNRTSPNNGYTRCYKLPAQSGNFVAQYCNQFFTSNAEIDGRITGADIDWANKTLVLSSMTKSWKFNFSTTPYIFPFPIISSYQSITQKEGICFKDSCHVLLTDELIDNLNIGGNLYELLICDIVTIPTIKETFNVNLDFEKKEIHVNLPSFYYNSKLTLEIYDLNGKKMDQQSRLIENQVTIFNLNTDSSIFMMLIKSNNKVVHSQKVIRYAQ